MRTTSTKELVKQLGTMADSRLATMYKMPVYHVRKLRLSNNIERFRGHRQTYCGTVSHNQLESLIPRLGEESDASIAKSCGISRERVRQLRNELRIPLNPFGHLKLSREVGESIVKDLPTLSNSEITKKYQIDTSTIRSLRTRFDIPQKESTEDAEKAALLEKLVPELGTASDYTLADKFKIHHAVVRYNRITRDIPPFKARWSRKLSPKQEKELKKDLNTLRTEDIASKYGICKALVYQYRVRFDMPGNTLRKLTEKEHDKFIAALGNASDYEIARRFGLSTSYVYVTRQKREIPVFVSK